MGWRDKTPKEKGESFDAQFKDSKKRADGKRRAGKQPYDLDAKIKPEDRRKK